MYITHDSASVGRQAILMKCYAYISPILYSDCDRTYLKEEMQNKQKKEFNENDWTLVIAQVSWCAF